MEDARQDTPPPSDAAAAQAATAPPAAPENREAAEAGKPGRLANLLPTFTQKAKTCLRVAKETWDEHDVWVNALAVKGGVSAIVIAGAAVVTYTLALPFLLTAGLIAGAGLLGVVGIYSIAAGGAKAWDSARVAYARAMGREPPQRKKKDRPDIMQRMANAPFVKKIKEHPLGRKFINSRAWQMTLHLTKRHEDTFLNGMAVGGAVLSLALGVAVLSTQILVLPVIAASTLFTFAAVEVATCFASGVYGLYLSGHSILERHREKKAERLAQKQAEREKPLQLDAPAKKAGKEKKKGKAAAPQPAEEPKLLPAPVAPVFSEKAQPANDDAAAKKEPDPVAVPAQKDAPPKKSAPPAA